MGGTAKPLVGFIFGNVDKKGRLDEDYLEDDAKDNIDNLEGQVDGIDSRARDDGGKRGSATPIPEAYRKNAPRWVPTARVDRPTVTPADEDEDYDDYDEEEEKSADVSKPVTAKVVDKSTAVADGAVSGKGVQRKKVAKGKTAKRLPKPRAKDMPQSYLKDDIEELTSFHPMVEPASAKVGDVELHSPARPLFNLRTESSRFNQQHSLLSGAPLLEATTSNAMTLLCQRYMAMADDVHPVLNSNWEKSIRWSDGEDEQEEGNKLRTIVLGSQINALGSTEGGVHRGGEEGSLRDNMDASAGPSGIETGEGNEGRMISMEFRRPVACAQLDSDAWLGNIGWDSSDELARDKKHTVVMLDLNDDRMIFQKRSEGQGASEDAQDYLSLVIPSDAHAERGGKKAGAPNDASRFNLSNDKYYFKKKVNKKAKDAASDHKVRHALPALKMLTSRLTDLFTPAELQTIHRPRGRFIRPSVSSAQGKDFKRKGSSQLKIKLISLVDFEVSLPNKYPANSSTVERVWKDAQETFPKLLKAYQDVVPKIMIEGERKPVKPNHSLGQGGYNLKGNVDLWIVNTKVWPIRAVNYKPLKEPLRPPGAFKTLANLSIRDGHVFLLEYVEEHPLLLSNRAMGMKLLTFYRKANARDESWRELRDPLSNADKYEKMNASGGDSGGSWGQFGHVVPLNEGDESPFLADLGKGQKQLAVDCNLFRAPAFHHHVPKSDFLLIRTSVGKWMVRELTSVIVVGQQEPHMKTPWPGSVQIREYEERRFQDYCFRTLRKKTKDPQTQGAAFLQVPELKKLFPKNSDQLIRNRLRNLIHCTPVNVSQADGRWCMKAGTRIPEEVELRKICTPEMVCAFESMRSCQERLSQLGIKRHELLRVSNERLKLAIDLLPHAQDEKDAAKLLVQFLQIASWALISNFVDVVRDGRGNLMLTGLGDPSGRGRGVSYVKAPAKAAEKQDDKGKGKRKTKLTVIAGTKTDLRKLSMPQARKILLSLGVPDEEIGQLTRWNRINLIQRLSTAAAADGSELGEKYAGFARRQRKTIAESQRVYQAKCRDIVKKQSLALTEGIGSMPYGEEENRGAGGAGGGWGGQGPGEGRRRRWVGGRARESLGR